MRPEVLSDEWYLVARLKLLGFSANVFDGQADFEQRRERARTAIKHGDLADTECWKVKGTPQTFSQAFAIAYGEAL